MIRTAVIGVGRLGAEHARILSTLPGSELVGLHDQSRERATDVAEPLGVRAWSDMEGLLEAAEAVVIAVPTGLHYEVADAALRAGCHALVEKPLASSVAEAEALVSLADELDRVLAVGHVERFNSALRTCEPFLERPGFVTSLRMAPYQPRGTDVTVILDLMIHDIDLVLGIVASPVDTVSAVGVPVLTDSIDIANARLTFQNGAVADITASRVSLQRKRELRVFQPTGYLSLDLANGRGHFYRRKAGLDELRAGKPDARAALESGGTDLRLEDLLERVTLSGDSEEPLKLELEHYLRAAGGNPSRTVSGREGLAALEVAARIATQIEEGHAAPQTA